MEKYINLEDTLVSIWTEKMDNCNFIKSYDEVDNRKHELERIFAKFTYNMPFIDKNFSNDDCVKFKDFIANDFRKLANPPCNLYLEIDEIYAEWLVPEEFLIIELSSDEIKNIMNNIENQLKTLKVCDLRELHKSGGYRGILQESYYDKYYEKNEFSKLLIAK